jgi:hypothetical protein
LQNALIKTAPWTKDSAERNPQFQVKPFHSLGDGLQHQATTPWQRGALLGTFRSIDTNLKPTMCKEEIWKSQIFGLPISKSA